MTQQESRRVAVVGAGVFGCVIALRLAEAGMSVDLYERDARIMQQASRKVRLHLGYHYPRHDETARQCLDSYGRFVAEFPECVEKGFPNAYFIAAEDSHTSPEEYLAFCDRNGLDHRPVEGFPVEVRNTALGIFADEAVFDFEVLTETLERRIDRLPNLALRTNHEYGPATGGAHDVVVNATYASLNALSGKLGYPVTEATFEYTVMPIVRLEGFPKVGITVLDGPFMNVLPLGKTGNFLLYSVDHTVIDRTESESLPPDWLSPDTAPFRHTDKQELFKRMVADSKHFVPALRNAELLGFIEGPRMILPRRDRDDARPSIVSFFGSDYITVFSSKITHCITVAEEICEAVVGGVPETVET